MLSPHMCVFSIYLKLNMLYITKQRQIKTEYTKCDGMGLKFQPVYINNVESTIFCA
jgi:hypothetical protein